MSVVAGGRRRRGRALALLVAGAAGLLVPRGAAAQASGAAAGALLEIPATARALALGGAYTAVVGDEGNIFVNPAGLAAIRHAALGMSYEKYLFDSYLVSGGAAIRSGRLDLGLGVQVLNFGQDTVFRPDPAFGGQRGIADPGGAMVGAYNAEAVGAIAYRLGMFSLGGSAKYLKEHLSIPDTTLYDASGFAYDVGGALAFFDIAAFGVVVQNLGGDLTTNTRTAAPLPRTVRIGFALNIVDPQGTPRLMVVGDWVAPRLEPLLDFRSRGRGGRRWRRSAGARGHRDRRRPVRQEVAGTRRRPGLPQPPAGLRLPGVQLAGRGDAPLRPQVAAVRIRLRTILKVTGAAAALLLLVVIIAWCASREVRYVVRAAAEEALILARRTAISRMVADPATDRRTRAKLELVLAVRDFAADSLHLAARRTYTTYSRIARDTLVLVLSASPSDRLVEITWSYPVVGRVPYKGFFDRDQAVAEAQRLEREGFDTYLRVSNAFSTLGWFNDPLLSTIVREDSVDLAATVVHEILHNTVWVPGQVAFDESLAEFVGYRGAERFFRARGDSVSADRAVARWQDEIRLAHFYDTLAVRLDRLYRSGVRGAALAPERLRIFEAARDDLAGPVGRTLRTIDGRLLARRSLNNAVVIAQRLYRSDLDRFEELLRENDGDLVRSLGRLERRLAGAADPWAALGAPRGR